MITHDHELIFIHIPKCAGRSINDVFNQRFDHFTARHYAKEYPFAWKNYSRFTVVRNPFARLVSIFTYIQAHRRHSNEPIGTLKRPYKEGHILTNPKVHPSTPTFSEWVKANIKAYNEWENRDLTFINSPEGMRGYDGQLGSPFWFTSQWERICLGDCHPKVAIDHRDILKMEDGMDKVGKWLSSLTGREITIPHTNKSNDLDFHSFYDDETLEMVKAWSPIVEDCKNLNYKFFYDDL